MKKITFKIGVIMACFAMICTSVVGFTLAQFMTSKNAGDSATMAKWGVEINAAGGLFNTEYDTDEDPAPSAHEGGSISVSVEDADAQKIVAPGTFNDGGLTFGVTGTPQVAVNVTFTVTTKDIYLKDTAAVDTAIGGEGLAADYYPVVYVLNDGIEDVVTGTLAQVETYLEALGGNYQANTDLTDIGSFKLTWSYEFTGHTAEDTLLGNIAAEKTYTPALVAATDYELEASFAITITVTQID